MPAKQRDKIVKCEYTWVREVKLTNQIGLAESKHLWCFKQAAETGQFLESVYRAHLLLVLRKIKATLAAKASSHELQVLLVRDRHCDKRQANTGARITKPQIHTSISARMWRVHVLKATVTYTKRCWISNLAVRAAPNTWTPFATYLRFLWGTFPPSPHNEYQTMSLPRCDIANNHIMQSHEVANLALLYTSGEALTTPQNTLDTPENNDRR